MGARPIDGAPVHLGMFKRQSEPPLLPKAETFRIARAGRFVLEGERLAMEEVAPW